MSPDDEDFVETLRAAYPLAKVVEDYFPPDWTENPVWDRLRSAYDHHPLFGLGRHAFAAGHQLLLSGGMFHPVLVRALRKKGPEGTLKWLHRVFSVHTFISRRCAELIGAEIETEVTLSNGVHLLPLQNMKPSWHSDQLKAIQLAPRYMVAELPTATIGMYQMKNENFSEDVKKLQTRPV